MKLLPDLPHTATLLRLKMGLLLLALLLSTPLYARTYRCVDAQGNVSFQDHACQSPNRRPDRPRPQQATKSQTGRHFMWNGSSPAGSFSLLGSLYFGSPALFPLPEQVMAAYRRSDVLIIEVDLSTLSLTGKLADFIKAATYRDGTTLKEHLSPETWQLLAKTAGRMGLSVSELERQKPWLAGFTLYGLLLKQEGYSGELGIGNYFVRQAELDKKPVIELETLSSQFSAFNAFSEVEQDQFLRKKLLDLTQNENYFSSIITAWRNGDTQQMNSLLTSSLAALPESKALYQSLIIDRKFNLADKIAKLVKDGKHYFIVVGVNHLVGKESIINLLRERDFSIVQQ